MSRQIVVVVPSLPDTNEGFTTATETRLSAVIRTMLMNGAYVELKPLLNATQSVDSVHGTARDDRTMAAFGLQTWAKKNGQEWVANHSIQQLRNGLTWALRGIRDEHGNRIDPKSRRLKAIEDQSKRFNEEHA